MSGPIVAAVALAAALVAIPPAGRRIAPVRAGRPRIPPGGVAGCAAGVVGVGVLAAATLPPAAVLAAAMLAVTGVTRHRRRQRIRCALGEVRELETALDILIGELRVGAHPVRALSVAAAETAGTKVGAALHAVASRARLGADVAAGLRSVAADSVVSSHWERLAVCWRLAEEHGLAIAALMRAAQRDMAERQRFWGRVAAGMAGARATAAILAALPVLGVLLGQMIGAAPVGFLLGGHVGGWCLDVGVALSCVGLWWSDRITDRATA